MTQQRFLDALATLQMDMSRCAHRSKTTGTRGEQVLGQLDVASDVDIPNCRLGTLGTTGRN